jgi:hypothetical protein
MKVVWHGDRVMSQIKAEMFRRGQRAAHEAQRHVQTRLSVTGPPAPQGVASRRRTGALARSIVGRARVIGNRVVVEIHSLVPLPRLRWTLAHHAAFVRGTRRVIMRILRDCR